MRTPSRGRSSSAFLEALLAAPCIVLTAPSQDTASAGKLILESASGERTERALSGLSIRDLRELPAALVGFEGFPAPDSLGSDAVEVSLVGGDRLVAKLGAGEGERLALELAGGARLSLHVDRLEGLVFSGLAADQRAALERPREGDRLYWRRPEGIDRVDGTLEGFGSEGVRFAGPISKRSFAWSEVAALFIEALGAGEGQRGEGAPVVIDLADGGRLHAALVRLDGSGALVSVAPGSEILLPPGAIEDLAVDDGTFAFLSELAPSAADEGSPFGDDLGMRWPHRVDRCVTGTPLVAGGETWRRGIGVHAPSRLVWQLDGGWKELRGSFAIDDSVLQLPYHGSVKARIRVDGETRWESGLVRGGSAPIAIPRLPLSGARELALEVEMAENHYVADRADWLRLILVRA
ncbi:MAG TPA: NPCBM/NEW2 domain-containing protein [Planctomycetota bacterium]|nr:NPCBM/NEW2 domain-containing protein [Planctomycetota bacterium]